MTEHVEVNGEARLAQDMRPETKSAVNSTGTSSSSPSNQTIPELGVLRDEIGRIDRDLVALIARRVMVARTIGETKRSAGLPTLDPAREAQLVRAVGGLAREAGLEADDLREIFWHLIALARRAQVEER